MQLQAVVASSARPNIPTLAMCRGLSQKVTGDIVAISSLRKKQRGETVFAEGDDADSIYEVVSGTLRLYKMMPDGRRQIVGFPSTGHLLGVAPEGTHVYTAEAITDVTLRRYPRASFDRLVDDAPGLARRLWAATADELRFAQDQLLLLGRKTSTEKVASFLLLLAAQQNVEDEIAMPMTRGDMGDYLGLTIETVSRTLTKFKRDKVIALPSLDRAVLLNRDELELLAGGGRDDDE
jgi:CRP/FNR family transcriptional regulator, anaerobic regulatory protein